MDDYELTIKIRNGRLLSAMTGVGCRGLSDLSKATGVHYTSISRLANFKQQVRDRHGNWTGCVLKICKYLAVEPDDIFPTHMQHKLQSNKAVAMFEASRVESLFNRQLLPSEDCIDVESSDVINQVVETLSERESIIIRLHYFDEMPLAQIAKKFKVTRQRMAGIHDKALFKMRHPERTKKLKQVCSFNVGKQY